MRITIGVVATASNRDTRAAIADASRRSSAASRGRPPAVTAARLSCRCASFRHALSSSWVAGRGARSGASAGGVASAAWRPATSVPRSAATSVAHRGRRPGGDQLREELGGALVDVLGVGDERLEHRDRRGPAVAGHDLGPAREARHARERRLLGQVGGQLEVRVEARLDPPVRLEQQPPADHHRGVRLVAAEGRLVGGRDGRGLAPHVANPADGRHTSAAACPAVGSSSRAIAGIVRPSAIAAASARHAPSPSAASRKPPLARGENGMVPVDAVAALARPPPDVDQRQDGVADSANACASRRDGTSPFATYQRRAARSSRSSARTAAATASRPGVTGVRRPPIAAGGCRAGRAGAAIRRPC